VCNVHERAATAEHVIEQIGRAGVVILPPQLPEGGGWSQQPGVARIRRDAYAAANRRGARPMRGPPRAW